MMRTNRRSYKCNEIISWLDKKQTAENEEFEHQQKNWRKAATLSLPSCTRLLVGCLEECLVASLVEELPHLVVLLQGPPLKRWIKSIQVEG